MGYDTSYSLEISHAAVVKKEEPCPTCGQKWTREVPVLDKIRAEHPRGGYANIGALLDGKWSPCKWYDHEEDMIRISAKYPEVLFTLRGEGEDNEDPSQLK